MEGTSEDIIEPQGTSENEKKEFTFFSDKTYGYEASFAGNFIFGYVELGIGLHFEADWIDHLLNGNRIDSKYYKDYILNKQSFSVHGALGVQGKNPLDLIKDIKNRFGAAIGVNLGITVTDDSETVKDLGGICQAEGGSVRVGPLGLSGSYSEDAKNRDGAKAYNISWAPGGGYEAHFSKAGYKIITIKDIIKFFE